MLQCIVIDDMVYSYPICILEAGQSGKGYICGLNPDLPDKPIHLTKTPSIKEWWEDKMMEIVISDGNYVIPLDRDYKWDVIERWCELGANMEFFMRQF
jgi:hypothetical protein